MGILCDNEIIEAVKRGDIYIDNFNPDREYDGTGRYTGKMGPNGYDLTLNEKLLIYKKFPLDMKEDNPFEEIIIPPEGLVLQPGVLYLGKTNEFTKTEKYVPALEGRSSIARLGMQIHITSGFGDVGFHGFWTLEIDVIHPLRIYPNTSICQIIYHTIEGQVKNTYKGKYHEATDVMSSRMYKDEIFDQNNGTYICDGKSMKLEDNSSKSNIFPRIWDGLKSPKNILNNSKLDYDNYEEEDLVIRPLGEIKIPSVEEIEIDENDILIEKYMKPLISKIRDLKTDEEKLTLLNNIHYTIENFAIQEGFNLLSPHNIFLDWQSDYTHLSMIKPDLHSYLLPIKLKEPSTLFNPDTNQVLMNNQIYDIKQLYPENMKVGQLKKDIQNECEDRDNYLFKKSDLDKAGSSFNVSNIVNYIEDKKERLIKGKHFYTCTIKNRLIEFSKYVGLDFTMEYAKTNKCKMSLGDLINSINGRSVELDLYVVYKDMKFEYDWFISRTIEIIKHELKMKVIQYISSSSIGIIQDIFGEFVSPVNMKRNITEIDILITKSSEFVVKFSDYCYAPLNTILKKEEVN